MRLFQFNLPLYDNAGRPLHMAHKGWRIRAIGLAGGVTQQPAQGAWEADGKLYQDELAIYTVALEDGSAPEQFDILLAEAFKRFPDQLAIYTAEIGKAHVYNRGA